MITHLEPDILECEVKRALENITTNKASGGDGIPVELFQILKDDAVKANIDNLISGSSAFSKTSLNIWNFIVYVLLKPGLENFEHYFTSM